MRMLLVSAVVIAVVPSASVQASDIVLECVGFAPPADVPLTITKKSGVIPFKAQLIDENSLSYGPGDIAAPVFSLAYSAVLEQVPEQEVDPTQPGRGNIGNLFVWDDSEQMWGYNLSIKNLAIGYYHVNAVEQPDHGYVVSPICHGEFVRQ